MEKKVQCPKCGREFEPKKVEEIHTFMESTDEGEDAPYFAVKCPYPDCGNRLRIRRRHAERPPRRNDETDLG